MKVQIVLPATTSTEIWDLAGLPLSQLDQSSIMTVDNMVDAALAGFDQGEAITLPSVNRRYVFVGMLTFRSPQSLCRDTNRRARLPLRCLLTLHRQTATSHTVLCRVFQDICEICRNTNWVDSGNLRSPLK